MMRKKEYFNDMFIVEGSKGKYIFFTKDMNHPHPGVFLFADDFEDHSPHIVYLENSESVSESVKKILNNPRVKDCLIDCFLGVSVIQNPNAREEMVYDIIANLKCMPECNKLLSFF